MVVSNANVVPPTLSSEISKRHRSRWRALALGARISNSYWCNRIYAIEWSTSIYRGASTMNANDWIYIHSQRRFFDFVHLSYPEIFPALPLAPKKPTFPPLQPAPRSPHIINGAPHVHMPPLPTLSIRTLFPSTKAPFKSGNHSSTNSKSRAVWNATTTPPSSILTGIFLSIAMPAK